MYFIFVVVVLLFLFLSLKMGVLTVGYFLFVVHLRLFLLLNIVQRVSPFASSLAKMLLFSCCPKHLYVSANCFKGFLTYPCLPSFC